MNIVLRVGLLLAAAAVAGCAARQSAPVVERSPAEQGISLPVQRAVTDPRPETYTVRRGDTLYGIALDFGLDYREIAEWNAIANPNLIRVGDVLRLRAPAGAAPAQSAPAEAIAQTKPVTVAAPPESHPLAPPVPVTQPRAAASKPDAGTIARIEPRRPESSPAAKPGPPASQAQADDEDSVDWGWPANGKIVARFSEPASKGVDIAGKLGDPVIASAGGKVVYSGSGLRGYGRLVIIKHTKNYLSAYAHNNQIFVKEGQNVVKGQKIGEIGTSDTDSPKLHFEIRRFGKPVDPMKFLPERPS